MASSIERELDLLLLKNEARQGRGEEEEEERRTRQLRRFDPCFLLLSSGVRSPARCSLGKKICSPPRRRKGKTEHHQGVKKKD